jgi:hypothetical protein
LEYRIKGFFFQYEEFIPMKKLREFLKKFEMTEANVISAKEGKID